MKIKHIISRSLAILLIVLIAIGAVACSANESSAPVSQATPTPEATKRPTYVPKEGEKDIVFYVSPDGNDETGNPYRTLECVKEVISTIDKTNLDSITVYFKEGHYDSYTTSFTQEDSGTENCRITYASYNGEEVVFTAGKVMPVSAFHPITDESVKAALSEDVRDKVLCASLTEIGMTLEDCHALREAYRNQYGIIGLYADGQRQTNARFPDGDEQLNPVTAEEYEGTTIICYYSKKWKNFASTWNVTDRDVFAWGCWKYDWADSIFRVTDINPTKMLFTMNGTHHYGVDENARYCFYNVLEAISEPGEWSYDLEKGMIYYYPPENFENSTITVSTYPGNIVSMSNASNITFSGIVFECGQGMGVGGNMNNVTFDNCIIRNVNSYGMRVVGNNIHITNCEFCNIGTSCLDIDGGDRETLTPSGNLIENCYFHNYGQIRGLGYGDFAAWIRGMACTFRHNECAYAPFGAVYFFGNEHIIEYNEFHHLGSEMDDGGIVYSYRHYDFCRNEIRYNYFHDIVSHLSSNIGGRYAPQYFYEDDGLCDTKVYGNLFLGTDDDFCGNKVAGFDSLCDNNVFINTRKGPQSWGAAPYGANRGEERDAFLLDSAFMSDIWKEAYPEMDKYRNGAMGGYPDDPNVSICNNLWFAPEKAMERPFIEFIAYIDGYSDKIKMEGNLKYSISVLDQYFVDPENGDYTMREDAPIFDENPDFVAIPFALMGRNKE